MLLTVPSRAGVEITTTATLVLRIRFFISLTSVEDCWSKVRWGNGAAPVTGAWIPILIVVSVTPVRSGTPENASRGGAGVGAASPGPGWGAGDGAGGPMTAAARAVGGSGGAVLVVAAVG